MFNFTPEYELKGEYVGICGILQVFEFRPRLINHQTDAEGLEQF